MQLTQNQLYKSKKILNGNALRENLVGAAMA